MKTRLVDLARDLTWALWRELGVSGVVRLNPLVVVDLDWLVAFTPMLAADDARIREAYVAWCVNHDRWLSVRRLRSVIQTSEEEVSTAFDLWSRDIPGLAPAASGSPSPNTQNPSPTPELERTSLSWLRARALFGVGAKADVICMLVRHGDGWLRSADLGDTGYSRRTVSTVLGDLIEARLLAVRGSGAGRSYRLQQRDCVEQLLGSEGARWPRWDVIFPWLAAMLTIAGRPASTDRVEHVRRAEAIACSESVSVLLGWTPPDTDPWTWAEARVRELLAS